MRRGPGRRPGRRVCAGAPKARKRRASTRAERTIERSERPAPEGYEEAGAAALQELTRSTGSSAGSRPRMTMQGIGAARSALQARLASFL